MLARAIDTALDRTVVPGYSRIGYSVRRALCFGGPPSDPPAGTRVLVTGATSGLGLATARSLASRGAIVHILARDSSRGERAAQGIRRASGGQVHVELADLSSMSSVRSFTARFGAEQQSLQVLVNNAGVMSARRELSAEGHELTFATNVLGMFVLTNELLPLLLAGAPARIINISSGGMYGKRLDPSDLESERGPYSGPRAYARSKRAQVVLTELWAERLSNTGIVAHCMHPGWVDTPGVESSLPRFYRLARPLLRTPAEGADTILWLASAQEPARSSGGFWHDRRRRPTHRVPWTRETQSERRALWEACAAAAGPNGSQAEAILAAGEH